MTSKPSDPQGVDQEAGPGHPAPHPEPASRPSFLAASPWTHPATLWWMVLWAAMMLAAEVLRPALPVDETRYLAVAWEMFQSNDWVNYIVPHLNGAPYDHKPPLLFWLMTAGWHLFGVNDWWPSLVAPLFGLASLGLTVWLAGLIWPPIILGPDARKAAALSPLILIGGLFWALFTTLTMFDMMLTAFTLLAIGALVKAWRFGNRFDWALVALAIGLGVLAKGPAILLHILPAALLAPLWGPKLVAADPRPAKGWKSWYLSLLVSVLAGALLALAWAIPAGILGGAEYREAIFWGQSAGRVVDADDHARSWWWFFAVLPAMLLPWTLWPPIWRGFKRLPFVLNDAGVRLILVWFIPAFATFSIISGKQAHYLLPELPALALLAARLLTEPAVIDRVKRLDQVWSLAPLILIALLAAMVPYIADLWQKIPEEAAFIDGYWLLAFAALGLVVVLTPLNSLTSRLVALSGIMAGLVVCLHLAAAPLLASHYDFRPFASKIRGWMAEGRPVAYFGKYHGQFQFTGKLPGPIERIPAEIFETTDDWAWEHPHGIVIFQTRKPTDKDKALAIAPFRSRYLNAWPASEVEKTPGVIVDGMNKVPSSDPWEVRDRGAEAVRPDLVRKNKVPRDWTPFGPPTSGQNDPPLPSEQAPVQAPVLDAETPTPVAPITDDATNGALRPKKPETPQKP